MVRSSSRVRLRALAVRTSISTRAWRRAKSVRRATLRLQVRVRSAKKVAGRRGSVRVQASALKASMWRHDGSSGSGGAADFLPQICVVGGQAGEAQGSDTKCLVNER